MVYALKKNNKYLNKGKTVFTDKLEDAFIYNKLSKATLDKITHDADIIEVKVEEVKIDQKICNKELGYCLVCTEKCSLDKLGGI